MPRDPRTIFAALALVLCAGCPAPADDDEMEASTDDPAAESKNDSPGGGGSYEAQLCDRVEECGYLGPGYTVGDCTDIVSACTNQLLTSAHADWNVAAEGCLELVNCQNFGACFAAIDVCIEDVDIEFNVDVDIDAEDDGGDPPPPPADDDGGDEGPVDDGGDVCELGYQACVGTDAIEFCTEDGLYVADCVLVCQELGWEFSYGCGYDEASGLDICWCE